MHMLDPGEDPTEADLGRMAELQDEIDAFGQELDHRYLGPITHPAQCALILEIDL